MHAKTHAGLDLWPADPELNGFPGLMVEHSCVKFVHPAALVFAMSCGKTDRQTN